MMKRKCLFLILTVSLILFVSCNIRVNKSITIEDGDTVRSSLTTVNGNIRVGSECEIRGACRSVNGNIRIGDNSDVKSLQAVNGSIHLDEDVYVSGKIESVNGSVQCQMGVEIRGKIRTVNGRIELMKTRVRDDVTTYNGPILLADQSVIQGDVIVNEAKGSRRDRVRPLRIEIRDNSVVDGDIIVKDNARNVKVYLSGGGEVKGRIVNAELMEG